MKRTIICLLFIYPTLYLHAQKPEEEVNSAVKDYVDAFYYGDTSKIYRSISPQVVKYGFYTLDDHACIMAISIAKEINKYCRFR